MGVKMMCYGVIILLHVIIYGVNSQILTDVLAKFTPCCAQAPNIIENKRCVNKTANDFKCPNGRYAIPETELKFQNDKIVLSSEDEVYEISQNFCVTTLRKDSFDEVMALVCFSEDDDASSGVFSISSPRIIISLISVFFALLTFTVYCLVPDLRDLQGKCIMSFLLCMSIGYTWLTINQTDILNAHLHSFTCDLEAFMLYFWMISQFFWLNVICINVWRNVRLKHITISDPTMFKLYNCYAWGMALLMLLITLTAHFMPGDYLKPNFGESSCWLGGDIENWTFFYGPILCLLIVNTILFIITGLCLWKDSTGLAPTSKIVSHRYKCLLYLKIFVVMGVTWLCEPITFLVDTVKSDPRQDFIFISIFDYINLLQGVFIFIILVLTRKRALRGLARTRIFGYRLAPASCATEQRLEEDFDEMLENDLERNENIMQGEIK